MPYNLDDMTEAKKYKKQLRKINPLKTKRFHACLETTFGKIIAFEKLISKQKRFFVDRMQKH